MTEESKAPYLIDVESHFASAINKTLKYRTAIRNVQEILSSMCTVCKHRENCENCAYQKIKEAIKEVI